MKGEKSNEKYLIIILIIAFTASMLHMGIGCKGEVALVEEVEEEVEEMVVDIEEFIIALIVGNYTLDWFRSGGVIAANESKEV